MTAARADATIRRLRALRRDPALRESEGVFLAEGLHLAAEALALDAPIELAVMTEALAGRDEGRRLIEAIELKRLPLHTASPEAMRGLQDVRTPQPILLVVRRPSFEPEPALERAGPAALLVAAHGVQDPGNLGSVWRTADAAGATALCVTDQGVDLFHPRAVRATMGSVFRLPAGRLEPAPLIELVRRRGLALVGTAARTGIPHHRCDLARPLALFLGGEGAGLEATMLEAMDEVVRIPMRPGVESLSVGAAAAVLLFEAARQRGLFGG